MPYSVPLEVEEGREQRVLEQTLETAVASDILEHIHLAHRLASVVVFRKNVVRHQATIVELDRVLVRPFLPRLQTIVEVVRQSARRDIRDRRYVKLVHVADVATSIEKQSHRLATTCPGGVMKRRVAFACENIKYL